MMSKLAPPDSVPIPALLVERAIALARAEAGLALMHARRVAVRAVSALLGTIVACAFAQLAVLLLVAWPVLSEGVPLVNLLLGVVGSVVLSAGGAAFAVASWAGVGRERKVSAAAGLPPPSPRAAGPLAERFATKVPAPMAQASSALDERSAGKLAEEGSL